MCGITGVLGTQDDARRSVEQAAELQHHRGPDFFNSISTNNYCFSHNRLSVIDLSPRSNQPLENEKGILVFNGEIYNFKNLSKTYLSDENPFSDAVVLFRLLQSVGTAILPHLDGMFAFAWYDKEKKHLVCTRDRRGSKPLYYALNEDKFFFASEMKTVLDLLENLTGYCRGDDLNAAFLSDIITGGHSEFQRTPWRTIQELAPGTCLTIRIEEMKIRLEQWFSIPDVISAGHDDFIRSEPMDRCIDRLDSLLTESVRMHLISDAPTGILCSGGVDSSLVTAIACNLGARAAIFHAAVEDEKGELPYARMVASRYKLELHSIAMNRSLYLNSLVDTIYHLDVPMRSAPPGTAISELVKRN